jgi:hypothetical protein
MSVNTTENATSLLAREIARELAPLLRREAEAQGPDPKGLRDVRPALLNIDQTAKYLGRTVKGVRDLEKKGVLCPIRLDRKVQFRRVDLDAAIDRHAA